MESESLVSWADVLKFVTGGGVMAAIGGGIILWRKWRATQQENAKGDIDVARLEAEAEERKRQVDADFQGAEHQRVVTHWKALFEEMKLNFTEIIIKMTARQEAMEEEIEKRGEEHRECQRESARLGARVEYLTVSLEEKTQLLKELRQRMEKLEGRK